MTDVRETTARPGELIRTYRLEAGLSQDELADKLNMSKSAVSAWERGLRTQLRPSTIRELAAALNLTEDQRAALRAAAGQGRPPTQAVAPPPITEPRATVPRLRVVRLRARRPAAFHPSRRPTHLVEWSDGAIEASQRSAAWEGTEQIHGTVPMVLVPATTHRSDDVALAVVSEAMPDRHPVNDASEVERSGRDWNRVLFTIELLIAIALILWFINDHYTLVPLPKVGMAWLPPHAACARSLCDGGAGQVIVNSGAATVVG